MTSEDVPTTDEVREAYATRNAPAWDAERRSQFDRWLAEHDHQVRVDYEAQRNPSPILIENVDSKPAGAWLAEHDARLIEKLIADIDASSAVTWAGHGGAKDRLRARAAELREGTK